jgi:hypothetical protein
MAGACQVDREQDRGRDRGEGEKAREGEMRVRAGDWRRGRAIEGCGGAVGCGG